jgi:hypothetical protein
MAIAGELHRQIHLTFGGTSRARRPEAPEPTRRREGLMTERASFAERGPISRGPAPECPPVTDPTDA